jgi:protein-tyrosine-phosphatase
LTVTSAGSAPKPRVHPNTIKVLRDEFGIVAVRRRTRHLATLEGRHFDRVITLCDRAREVCPEFGERTRRAHWSIPDPASGESDQATYPAFQRVAMEINRRITHLLPVLAVDR